VWTALRARPLVHALVLVHNCVPKRVAYRVRGAAAGVSYAPYDPGPTPHMP
jgi:hypothetical protein